MAILSSKSYQRLKQCYHDADNYFSRGCFDKVISLSSEALSLLQEGVDWPIKANITNEKRVYPANFLLMRVKSVVAQSQITGEGIDHQLANSLLNDLESAMGLTKGDPTAIATYFNAALEYADVCVFTRFIPTDRHIAFALAAIKDAQNHYLSSGQKIPYAGALGREADIRTKFPANIYDPPIKALQCLEKSLDIFQGMNDQEMVFNARMRLARIYLHPEFLKDPNNIEKALSIAYSALDNMPEDVHLERYMILDVIGMAYAKRVYGSPVLNASLAVSAFELILGDFSDEENAKQWPEIVLVWIDVLLSNNLLDSRNSYIEHYLRVAHRYFEKNEMTSLLNLAEKRLSALLTTVDKYQKTYSYFTGLKYKHQIACKDNSTLKFSEGEYNQELKALHALVSDTNDEDLWIDIDWAISLDELDVSDRKSITNCLNRLQSVANKYDLSKRPSVFFETHIMIGTCLFELEEWKQGYEHITLAMGDVFTNVESVFRGISRKLYALPGSSKVIANLPLAAALMGDTKNALTYHEVNAISSLASDLEYLLLIDKQINRQSLYRTYYHVKQGMRILHSSADKDYFAEITRLEELQGSLDKLKSSYPDFLRSSIYRNLDQWLGKLDCWVFIPIIGDLKSFFLLIPPESRVSDIIVSDKLDVTYASELTRLVNKQAESGWAEIHPILQNRYRTFEDLDRLDSEFENMQSHLWNTYASWILDRMNRFVSTGNRDLCIIPSGALEFYPFSMAGVAGDHSATTYLIDHVSSISYAPSLYTLISLKEREPHYVKEPSLGAVVGREDPNNELPMVTFGPLRASYYFGQKNRSVLDGQDHTIQDVAETLKGANHWLFSGHADFHWGHQSMSKLCFTDGEMSVDLLEALMPGTYLRLVILSGCSTGLREIMGTKAESHSFTSKFLSLGALGVIALLWPQNDEAAALITERFYYYHLEKKQRPSEALRNAQVWLRDVTKDELRTYLLEKTQGHPALEAAARSLVDEAEEANEKHPYSDPVFWAGLILVGT